MILESKRCIIIIDMNLIVTRNKLMKEYSPSESEKYMNPKQLSYFKGPFKQQMQHCHA
jgi:hypothetical protein